MNLTRRRLLGAGGVGFATAVAGCLSEPGEGGESGNGGLSSGYAAFFVLYDWTETVAGDGMDIENVLAVGEAGHGWNPPSDLVLDVAESDVFVYLDTPEFSWAQNVAAQLEEEDGVTPIDLLEAVDPSDRLAWEDHDHDDEENHEEGDDHDHQEDDDGPGDEFQDPHVWIDPILAGEMVEVLGDQLAELDPDNTDQYRENASAYVDRLDEIDQQLRELSDAARVDVGIFAGHDSFRYVEDRYGFELHSPQGVSPSAEPSPDDIAETIDLVEDNDIDTILYDPLETDGGGPPPLAERILDSTDASEARPLSSGDGTTAEWKGDHRHRVHQNTQQR
ncbi:ABC transporter substrate-binding protein [Halobacteriales archaeon QH_6_66_25]|nr:MAG: ABC transporter substrate-binding protein [Halobacteriales archaeon QH_6_66_25]